MYSSGWSSVSTASRFSAGIERRPLGHRPALQHAADLQPQVVVVRGRMVLVHDEAVAAVAGRAAGRLGGAREVPLPAVVAQPPLRHPATLRSAPASCNPAADVRPDPGYRSSGRPARQTPRSASPASRCTRSAGPPAASRPSGRRAEARRRHRRRHPQRLRQRRRPPPAPAPGSPWRSRCRPRPASRPPASAARRGAGSAGRCSANSSRSVPATAMASVTRNSPSAPRFAASATRIDGRRHVDPVGDQPGPHPLGVERRPDQPRLAVAELAHGVEEMRHHPRPGREGGAAPPPRRRRCARG